MKDVDEIALQAYREQDSYLLTVSVRGKGFGFTKTLPFSPKGIQQLKALISFLEDQLEENIEKLEKEVFKS